MIKTIVALFALYESSLGNRLILQAAPAVPEPMPVMPAVPPAPPQQPPVTVQPPPIEPPAVSPPPAIPQPVAPVPPVQPVQPVQPIQPPPQTVPGRPLFPWELPPQPIGPPVGPIPSNPVNPSPTNPGIPPVTPPVNPGAPGVIPPQPQPPVQQPPMQQPPIGGANPWPWQQAPGLLQTKLECKVSPPNPASCAGLTRTITNPSENYEFLCTAPRGGCYGSTINIELTPMGYPIDRLKLFAFIGEYAAMNAKINIRNTRGDQVRIDEIKCDKIGACQNLQITMDPGIYMERGDVYCSFGACDGATVNGVPLYYYVEPI